jgi:hypothetical protein
MKYELKADAAERHPVLVTLNEKKQPVNLHGVDVTVDVPATAEKPASKRVAKGATQADLAYLYRKGHPFIIEVQETGK